MNVKIDSRKIEKGDIFVALKTLNHDGHDYVMDAIQKGASKVVVEHGKYPITTIQVSDTKEYLISYLKEHYYEKIQHLKLIGITGTNGKTTTCYCIYEALNKIGHKCAYIGTLGFYKEKKVCDLPNTTPEILDLYEMLIECEDMEYVVMEVSSHALSLRRVEGLEFDYAFFSNLTEDHLDYHKTMENYALAKQKLFHMLKKGGKAILNIDDAYVSYFLLESNENITYGFEKSDYHILNPVLKSDRSQFSILKGEKETKYETSLLGKHNIDNLTCVIILLDLINIDDTVKQLLVKKMCAPSGRMETFFYQTNRIIVDYAHTPDALHKILQTVKEFSTGNIYTIIGCGGDRERTKRPLMAKIATDQSNYVIFTTDNPRCENPKQIFNDMIQNLDNTNYEIIENREKAIQKGIQMCKKNDILLVLGKGHETYQMIGNEKKHFDDREVILKAIRS